MASSPQRGQAIIEMVIAVTAILLMVQLCKLHFTHVRTLSAETRFQTWSRR